MGASFEGFAIEQVIRRLALRPLETYFRATHSGAKLDLLVIRGRHRLGFEFKRADSPRVTRSMHADVWSRTGAVDMGRSVPEIARGR